MEETEDPRHRLDTAYQAWDRAWLTAEGRAGWLEPDPAVQEVAPLLAARGVRDVLDLGCGVGRHAAFLARLGFRVCALDGSPHGLAVAAQRAREAGVAVAFRQGLFTELPYEASSFDYVLSWNVIYHGDRSVVQTALAQIARVLRPGGLFQGTMLSTRHSAYGSGREVSARTFVIETDAEKRHPHFYCDAAELVALLRDFDLLSLVDREQQKPGSYHWHLLAERRRAPR